MLITNKIVLIILLKIKGKEDSAHYITSHMYTFIFEPTLIDLKVKEGDEIHFTRHLRTVTT